MKNKNTYWSLPKTNIIAGLICLRSALASGENARLIKMYNEDCEYPILIKNKKEDINFRKYSFNSGCISTINKINKQKNEIDAYLTLNYKACFGTQEAVDNYYNNGILSADNFKGIGRSHLVKITDMIEYYKSVGNYDRIKKVEELYFGNDLNKSGWFDFFRFDSDTAKEYTTKKFKHKLWVVEVLYKDEPKAKTPIGVYILNVIIYPLKFIPRKSVLKMDNYILYSFRIGSVTNGYEIEFQIPKKFSFRIGSVTNGYEIEFQIPKKFSFKN